MVCLRKKKAGASSAVDLYTEISVLALQIVRCCPKDFSDAIVAIGNPAVRLKWIEKISDTYYIPIMIHPLAYVSNSAKIGCGTVIEPMAVIHTDATVGIGCIISAGAVVNHNAILGDGVHCDCGAVISSGRVVNRMGKIVR